jgi:hypothetical protein
MDRIWIAMGMGWGVSRGAGDVGVMLKRARNKTEVRLVVRNHAIRSEAISFGTRRKQEVSLSIFSCPHGEKLCKKYHLPSC